MTSPAADTGEPSPARTATPLLTRAANPWDGHRDDAGVLALAGHLQAVQVVLDSRLERLRRAWPAQAAERAGSCLPVDPPTMLRELLDRGGKRVRPAMTYLGWVAADGERRQRGYGDVLHASAAVELLHAFALVHDDVMDESHTRRGAMTVHRYAAQVHVNGDGRGRSERYGESIAVLVGDLAHSEADLLAAELPARLREIWQQLVLELVAGQVWDLGGAATGNRSLEFARTLARQKTGNYTVARPLQLGAAAADAGPEIIRALGEYGRHAGEAFGLRDEVLGVYGDPRTTGKSADEDLRAGKPTVLLAVASQMLRGAPSRALARAGTSLMTDEDAHLLRHAMLERGVVARIEAMVDERIADAVAALDRTVLSEQGIERLTGVVVDLARRGH